MTFMRSLRRIGFADAVFARSTFGRSRLSPRPPRLPPCIEGADDALRQEQRHQDEHRAQHEQPVRRQRARGEERLGIVDHDRAQRRAHQRAAAADRDPESRTAISTLPSFEVTTALQIRKATISARQLNRNSAARVPSACTLKPRMSLKSVRPLLPPKPKSLRKKANNSAEVIACVMIER